MISLEEIDIALEKNKIPFYTILDNECWYKSKHCSGKKVNYFIRVLNDKGTSTAVCYCLWHKKAWSKENRLSAILEKLTEKEIFYIKTQL